MKKIPLIQFRGWTKSIVRTLTAQNDANTRWTQNALSLKVSGKRSKTRIFNERLESVLHQNVMKLNKWGLKREISQPVALASVLHPAATQCSLLTQLDDVKQTPNSGNSRKSRGASEMGLTQRRKEPKAQMKWNASKEGGTHLNSGRLVVSFEWDGKVNIYLFNELQQLIEHSERIILRHGPSSDGDRIGITEQPMTRVFYSNLPIRCQILFWIHFKI